MKTKPNILFILSDQHNAKILGCKGHPDVQTPHLDRMAAEGTRMDNAIAQNPICTPSRVCYLSGQYCHNHGYYGNSGHHPRGLPTVLGHFRARGYTTAAIGKIHCPEYWVEDDSDYFRELYPNCSVGGAPEYTAYLESKGVLRDRDDACLPENPGLVGVLDGRMSRLKYEDSPEGWTARETIGFMDRAAATGQPFFVHASLPRPHSLYTPSEPFWSLYEGKNLRLPPNVEYDMSLKAPHVRRMAQEYATGNWTVFEPRTYEAGRLRKLRGYLGCVSQVDYAVGQMLDWLRQKGLDRDTIVVYASDHGDYACEHGLMEKAPGICHDAITRVPMIWWAPGRFKTGHVATELVESVDLTQTFCALAGLEPMATSDGHDISHILRGERGDVREIAVTEFAWSRSLRKGKYRLVYYPREMFREEYPDGFGELYDLESDPWEMKNLYFEPGKRHVVVELERAMLDWLVMTRRPATVHWYNAESTMANKEIPQSRYRWHARFNCDGKVSPRGLKDLPGKVYL